MIIRLRAKDINNSDFPADKAEFLPVGIIIFDCTDRLNVLYYNAAVPAVFGYEPEVFRHKLYEKDLFGLNFPNAIDLSEVPALCETGEIISKNYIFEKADASALLLSTSSRITVSPSGRYLCHTAIWDITDDQRLEPQLSSARALLALACRESGVIGFEYEPNSDGLTYSSDETSIPLHQSVYQNNFLPDAMKDRVYNWIKEITPDGKFSSTNFTAISADGDEHMIKGRSTTLRDKYGCPYKTIGIVRDCGKSVASDEGISVRINGYGEAAERTRWLSEKLRLLQDSAKLITLDYDTQKDTLVYTLPGIKAEKNHILTSFLKTLDQSELISKSSHAAFSSALSAAINGSTENNISAVCKFPSMPEAKYQLSFHPSLNKEKTAQHVLIIARIQNED